MGWNAGGFALNTFVPVHHTGTITANGNTVSFLGGMSNFASVFCSFNGTYSGLTVVLEGSDDGTHWYQLEIFNPQLGIFNQGQNGFGFSSNATSLIMAASNGIDNFRVRATAFGSGTCNVRITPSTTPLTTFQAASSSGAIHNTDTQSGNNGATSYASQTVTTIRTNTSGKNFYLTHLTVSGDATAQGYFSLLDNGNQIYNAQFNGSTSAGPSYNDTDFSTPIQFTTNFQFEQWFLAAKNISVAFVGYEA